MPHYRYRAVLPDGSARAGTVEARDREQAIGELRGTGILLVDVTETSSRAMTRAARPNAKASAAAAVMIGELAVLLRAGLPLDRALALAIGNVEPRAMAARFAPLLAEVREGRTLSSAFARTPELVTPITVAMTEAGEANGRLPEALERLCAMLESAAELRRLVVTSAIYPASLLIIAIGVILMMLLVVVPQFDSLITHASGKLPAASQFVMDASHMLRENGAALLVLAGAAGVALRVALSRPAARATADRLVLRLPQIGALVQRLETARFARTLGALVEGEVALPSAVRLAQRTIANGYMAAAMERIADGVREGQGLAPSLAAARILPEVALGFIRTGEESSQLGMMLTRLADVLDRDVRIRLERTVAIATPMITAILGACVAGIIAATMSAILGFNDLAVAQ
jgi:general secretion pathway protein F